MRRIRLPRLAPKKPIPACKIQGRTFVLLDWQKGFTFLMESENPGMCVRDGVGIGSVFA